MFQIWVIIMFSPKSKNNCKVSGMCGMRFYNYKWNVESYISIFVGQCWWTNLDSYSGQSWAPRIFYQSNYKRGRNQFL